MTASYASPPKIISQAAVRCRTEPQPLCQVTVLFFCPIHCAWIKRDPVFCMADGKIEKHGGDSAWGNKWRRGTAFYTKVYKNFVRQTKNCIASRNLNGYTEDEAGITDGACHFSLFGHGRRPPHLRLRLSNKRRLSHEREICSRAGIGTLIQLFQVWRIGSRLPVVMGLSFTLLSAMMTLAAKDYA